MQWWKFLKSHFKIYYVFYFVYFALYFVVWLWLWSALSRINRFWWKHFFLTFSPLYVFMATMNKLSLFQYLSHSNTLQLFIVKKFQYMVITLELSFTEHLVQFGIGFFFFFFLTLWLSSFPLFLRPNLGAFVGVFLSKTCCFVWYAI